MTIQVCSYCTKEVRRIPDGRGEDVISHGACAACVSAVLRELVVIERDPETNFARPVAGVSFPTRNKAGAACAVIQSRNQAGTPTSAPAVPFSSRRAAA